GIDRALEVMEPSGAVKIVGDILLSRPRELYRHADLPRDHRGLADEVVHQAPPKATTDAQHVQRDRALVQTRDLGCRIDAAGRGLGGRPDLQPAVVKPGGAVLRLEI